MSDEVKQKESVEKLAVIRLRGPVKVAIKANDTMDMLRLKRKNVCVIIDVTPSIKGMIEKVKPYVTYGPIDDETLKLLQEKKGSDVKFYRLNNPAKGFGRKGIKTPFIKGGAYGNRGNKINDLIRRMLL